MVDVIAEIGWNHMGDMKLARDMIVTAADAGADFVKFQTWSVSSLKPGPWDKDGRREIYKNAELSLEKHLLLKNMCSEVGIKFLTSVFASNLVEMLKNDVGCDTLKLPSSELSNKKLLEKVNDVFSGCRLFVSTGAHSLIEVESALNVLDSCNITLLHCVSTYPCLPQNANLSRIHALRHNFGLPIGYSGHCVGITDGLLAIARFGALVVEKHFTLDHSLPGRDNVYAILPLELKELCTFAHSCALFDNESELLTHQSCEADVRNLYRGRWDSSL
jgi:N,N'-diacetyllegionaminate synthase